MILDSLLLFSGGSGGIGNSDGATDSPTTGTQLASNILDLGVVLGIPSYANGGGARDLGVGDDPAMKLMVAVTTAFVYGAGSGTMGLDLSGAPDSGTGTEGSYTVMWASPLYAQVGLVVGAQLANVDLPRPVLGQAMPRFLRMRYITAVATWTAGKVEATMVLDRPDQPVGSSGNLSGYQAGINIAN